MLLQRLPALVAAVVGLTWAAAFVSYAVDGPPLGTFLAVIAALETSLWRFHTTQSLSRRSFLHGYHAGYHDATGGVCPYPGCEVFPLAEERSRTIDG